MKQIIYETLRVNIFIGRGLKTYAFTVTQISFLLQRMKWKLHISERLLEELLANRTDLDATE
jgi:hypothetical protein